MNKFSALLLNGQLAFGKYPTIEEAETIIASGYTHIVNLCPKSEISWTAIVWPEKITVEYYPFLDGRCQRPEGTIAPWSTFQPFLSKLLTWLQQGHRLYIHCLGGHGRSATIAAILYGRIMQCAPEKAISAVYTAHQQRTEMKPQWRKLGAPQRDKQKELVFNFI